MKLRVEDALHQSNAFRREELVVHLEKRHSLIPARNETSCYWRVQDADELYREFATLGLHLRARRE